MKSTATIETTVQPTTTTPRPPPVRASKFIGGVLHYRCSRPGGVWLPATRFHKLSNKASKCGRSSWCPKCANALRRKNKRDRYRRELGLQPATETASTDGGSGPVCLGALAKPAESSSASA